MRYADLPTGMIDWNGPQEHDLMEAVLVRDLPQKIPVSERLPDSARMVLCYDADGQEWIGFFCRDNWFEHNGGGQIQKAPAYWREILW